MRVFYVTGLPRSRTSWLATLLSHGDDSLCLHEPLARTAPDRLHQLFAEVETRYAGIADCGLPVVAPDLPLQIPGPILVVVRDPVEVIASLARYFGGEEDSHAGGVALLHQRLLEFLELNPDHATIPFEALDDFDSVAQAWSYLLPDIDPPKLRIRELMRMRIDPLPEKLFEGANDAAIEAAKLTLTKSAQ
jgi:hypothetical protein